MIKQLLFLVFTANLSVSFTQDSLSYSWKEVMSYKVAECETWTVDLLENIYVSDGGMVHKYDSSGVIMFSQSIKSLGNTTHLIPVNTMKIIHFSEEQQTLCYFDNTLSSMNDCIDLTREKIVSAEFVCGSSQPNKVWVIDNLNSTLSLLSLDNLQQRQEVGNLRGILDINNITQIRERYNRLFVLDKSKGIYVFDIYATLIEFIPRKNIQHFDASEGTLFTVSDKTLFVRSLVTGEEFGIHLPIDGVFEMNYRNQFFFLRSKGNVHKYELQFFK